MRLGIALPTEDAVEPPAADGRRILSAETISEGARRIEAAGFDSAWVFDSIGRGFLLPDPLVALSVAATVTRRIELGTGVLQVPLRNPVDLAHRILTTHLVSAGGCDSASERARRRRTSPRSAWTFRRASAASARIFR